jgi:putative DNA primase/helicase
LGLGSIPIQYEQFDTSLQLLNCDSGVIDLKSSQLLDHKPEYLMTMIVPHPYIPHTVSPRWLQFLYECTGGNKELIEHLQRAAGSSISGHNPDNKFYLICGPTCTGKTTFLETIRHILNNYAVLTSYNTFLTIRRTSSGEPEMIELQGSRMVIASESNPGESFSPAKIKQYTSKEPIKTRALYSNIMVNITNRGKLWFVTNHPPRIDFSESAMWNRAIRIDFDHQVSEDKQDKRLLDKLISSNNAPGILSWLVEGCVKWYRDHDWNEEYGYKPDFKRDPLQVPESVRMATEQYRFEQCPISGFIDDCCEIDPGNESHSVTVADLREAYDHYVAEHDIQNPLSWKRATEYFRELGLEPGRQGGTGSRMWQYIRLRR